MTTTRRQALGVAAAAGSTAALTACGGGEGGAPGTGDGGAPDEVRVPVADVPEGGGLVRGEVVVTQPQAGEYRAFDARCPHQGCTVSEVTTKAIICPCHGSEFDPESGEMTRGPATEGLTSKNATVAGDEVVVS